MNTYPHNTLDLSTLATKSKLSLVKVCPDPGCEAVWHNIPQAYTKCNDCGGRVMLINENTYWNKFSNKWFQYDFETGNYFRPQKSNVQLSIDFD